MNAHSSISLIKQHYTVVKLIFSIYISTHIGPCHKSENEIHNSNQIPTHNTTTSKFQVHNDNKINLVIIIPKRCSKEKKIMHNCICC